VAIQTDTTLPEYGALHFDPGTALGDFVVTYDGSRSTTLMHAIEGPESNEITLQCTEFSEGEVGALTLSVKSSVPGEMTNDYFESPERRPVVDGLAWFGGELVVTLEDLEDKPSFRTIVIQDRYAPGNALFDVRESAGERVAIIAGIPGKEGCIFIAVGIAVSAAIIIVTRHRENMRAIELCVPLNNQVSVAVSGPAGSVTWSGGTQVHKVEER
jgi:hypothetical protein